MKNYAEMSDDEINFEVARHSFDAGWLERHYGKDGMVPDYCNNWTDAGPFMLENRIGIYPSEWPDFMPWMASPVGSGLLYTDKNPLRAAMIVFLMMKDNETRILAPDEVSDE